MIVDSREPESITSLLSSVCKVSISTLPVGDYVFGSVGIERKTRSDFESSIMDGRLFDQMERLKNSFDSPLLIIEGERPFGSLSRSQLLGAYSSIIVDFSIPVFFTKNGNATADLIIACAKRTEAPPKERPLVKKKRFSSLSQAGRAVLESFPMIGPQTAREMLCAFGSVRNALLSPKEMLESVKGVGKKRADMITRILDHKYDLSDD